VQEGQNDLSTEW